MKTLEPITTTLQHLEPEIPLDEAQLAAAAFLARVVVATRSVSLGIHLAAT